MADDLKPMLTKLLASGGKKKFFFAYGAGKRKDGKGDGELAVSGKKPKKAEIEGELADCKEVMEGVCWCSPDGGTVFFQGKGKKISPMIVAKMALTAKRAAGKQFDFQVPSAEEEAKAEKMAEGEADEIPPPPPPPAAPTAKTPPAAPPQPQPGKAPDLQGRLKSLGLRVKSISSSTPARGKLDPLFQKAAGLVQQGSPDALQALTKLEEALNSVRPDGTMPDAPATETAADPAESAYQARVKALTEGLKKALTSGTPAGQEAKLRFSESQVFSRKKDFKQANALLDVVEGEIKKALAEGTEQPGKGREKSEPGPKAGDDPAAEYKAKLAQWTPAIKQAMAARGPTAADMAKLLAQATALSKPGGDMAQALEKLTECHDLAAAALAGAPAPGTTPPPPGGKEAPPTTDPKKLAAQWNDARTAAVAKLQDELKEVVASQDPDAGPIELELRAVMKQLAGKLETRQQAAEMEKYLQSDTVVADISEVAFDLKTPLLKVLDEIKPLLPA